MVVRWGAIPLLPSTAAPLREGRAGGDPRSWDPLRNGHKYLSPECRSSALPELPDTRWSFLFVLNTHSIKQCPQSSFLCKLTYKVFMETGGEEGCGNFCAQKLSRDCEIKVCQLEYLSDKVILTLTWRALWEFHKFRYLELGNAAGYGACEV